MNDKKKKIVYLSLAVLSALILTFCIRPFSETVYIYANTIVFWVIVLYYLYHVIDYLITLYRLKQKNRQNAKGKR